MDEDNTSCLVNAVDHAEDQKEPEGPLYATLQNFQHAVLWSLLCILEESDRDDQDRLRI